MTKNYKKTKEAVEKVKEILEEESKIYGTDKHGLSYEQIEQLLENKDFCPLCGADKPNDKNL